MTGRLTGWDLNGNISEFVEGLQLSDGVIRLVADNNAASPDAAINALYKSVLVTGLSQMPGLSAS